MRLGIDIVPYIVVFVIPILGRMSDFNESLRKVTAARITGPYLIDCFQLVSNTFATLIKLVPLESGIPNPPGMSEELIAQKQRFWIESYCVLPLTFWSGSDDFLNNSLIAQPLTDMYCQCELRQNFARTSRMASTGCTS